MQTMPGLRSRHAFTRQQWLASGLTLALVLVALLAPLPLDAYARAIAALVPPGTADANLAGFEVGRRIAAEALGIDADAQAAPTASPVSSGAE